MARAAFAAAIAAVWAAIPAVQFYYYFLNDLQPGAGITTTTTTSAAQTSASAGEFQVFLTLVAAGALHAAVALIYRHLHQAEATAAAGNRRLPDSVAFLLLAAAGLLVLQGVPGAVDDAVVGALGVAAFRALPAAAAATFFLGMMTLIFAAHVRAGGEGGGGAVAGDGQIQGAVLLSLLTRVAFAAAAGLVCMMAIALCAKY